MSHPADLEPARLLDYLLSAPPGPLLLDPSSDEGWEPLDTEPPPLPRRRRRSVALLAAAALLLAGGLGIGAGEDRDTRTSMEAGRSPGSAEPLEEVD